MDGDTLRRRIPRPAPAPARRGGAESALPLALLVAAAALACGPRPAAAGEPAPETPPAVLDLVLPGGRTTRSLDALAAGVALEAGESARVTDLGRDAHSSHQLVALRGGETLHRHDRHDLFVVLLRGHGDMFVGAQARPAGPGSIFWVPRGVAHAFRNASAEPAVAYVAYVPPFDGEDRIPAE